MKNCLVGIIMVFAFIQPLASKALVFYKANHNLPSLSLFSYQQDNHSTPSTEIESLNLDLDDDDEFTIKNNTETNVWIKHNPNQCALYPLVEYPLNCSVTKAGTKYTAKELNIFISTFRL